MEQANNIENIENKEGINLESKKPLKKIWLDVTLFVQKHDYTAIAIGAGAIVGTFLFVKHIIKKK